MRETLEECVRFDELANKVYLDLERRCSDPEVAALMAKMAVDEASHVSWWRVFTPCYAAPSCPRKVPRRCCTVMWSILTAGC